MYFFYINHSKTFNFENAASSNFTLALLVPVYTHI